MYICNCNAITDREVDTAIEAGVERWDDVHAFYGCEPCCGKCECEIKDAMQAADEGPSAPSEPFFQPAMAGAAG